MRSAAFITSVNDALFNASEWTAVGEPMSFAEFLKIQGLRRKDFEDEGRVDEVEFDDGNTQRRIVITLKKGGELQLKVGSKSELEEGDTFSIDQIYGQEFSKIGRKNIVRFDVSEEEPEEEEEEEEEPKEEKPKAKKRNRK